MRLGEEMLGEKVVIPLGYGSETEGVVVKHNIDTGQVIIKDDEDQLFKGFEYQLEFIEN